jgi:hypothetical protein
MYPCDTVEPNGPEHEQITPTVTGDPEAAEVPCPPPDDALAAGELELLLLPLDEHALIHATIVIIAATPINILRHCIMEPCPPR